MAKSIASIGYTIPGKEDLNIDFQSSNSLMDADIIFFCPYLPYYERSKVDGGYYQGKVSYGSTASFNLRANMSHWKRELGHALSVGKTVFFLLDEKEEFFLDTGERQYSGTGRNRNTTLVVEPANNYQVLPAKIGTIHCAHGKEILSSGNPVFKDFFNYFRRYLSYKVYIENVESGTTIFTGKDKTKVLGLYRGVNGGHLILLPYIDYDEVGFTEKKENQQGKQEEFWTDEALEFGNVLVSHLIKISDALSQDNIKTPPPLWVTVEEYKSSKELLLQKEIEKKTKQLAKIQGEVQELDQKLVEAQVLKGLLFEQGKPLEKSVTEALRLLGYKAENYDDGTLELDHVILSPEGFRFVGECEGKDEKDIDISKFRQLLESMNADFHRDEVEEKAFGIANTL